MPSATSSVNAAIIALVAAIGTQVTALDPSAAISVTEGPPTQNQPDDLVVIGERINQQYEPHALVGSGGSGWLHETFEISVHIDVYRGGDLFSVARLRALAIAKACDDAVRLDPSLAGTVYLAYPSAHSYEQLWEPDNKGVRVVADMFVHCQAIP